MSIIKDVGKDRQILVPAPSDWPEGCEVLIEPISKGEGMGRREEDWPATADGVAALLARWDQHEPLEMTPEEEARWRETQRRQKEVEKLTFAEEAERRRRWWE